MIISIFDFTNYKRYLREKLELLSKKERGWKVRAAAHIGCQASYLSQILNGKPDLTLDQAHKLNQLFSHDKIESRFFILLVEYHRAVSPELKEFLNEQMQELMRTRFDLKKRLKNTEQISPEDMNKYYSTWFYSAIHIALAVADLQDAKSIANRFHLPVAVVISVIEFLEQAGLVEKDKGQYRFTKMRIHLDRESDFIQRHHINWRSQSLQSVEKNLAEDTHFSTVFAATQQDFEKIKEIFLQAIESARTVIRSSPSEEVYSITLDVFKT